LSVNSVNSDASIALTVSTKSVCYGPWMSLTEVPFEEPLLELRHRIAELRSFPGSERQGEIRRLEKRLEKTTRDVYGRLTRWQRALVARHSDRPSMLDYVDHLMDEWIELHGDRAFADDPAIVSGFARFRGRSVAVIGHQKGRGTKQRIYRNFGQPRPEGYRKALRIMKMAERFGKPILTFVDTPGAYPGIGAEERGQAEAIARNLIEMASMRVPILVTVTGEGGSGGALALGVGNRVFILEHSIYSVISPEGCAAILWKDQAKKEDAAEAMKVTAQDLLGFGIVDEIIPEPLGGAHSDPIATCSRVGEALHGALETFERATPDELIAARYARFRALGEFEGTAVATAR